jgi:hypothetical protein
MAQATGQCVLSDDPAIVRRAIGKRPEKSYVYVLRRPCGEPFYVGKGMGMRLLNHEAEARNTARLSHKLNIIRQLLRQNVRVLYEVDSFHHDEHLCFAREAALIRALGRFDIGVGQLANCTDGGEGTCNPSEESKERAYQKWCGVEGDSEYSVINRFVRQLIATEAVPIKPLSKLRIDPLTPHPSPRGFSRRQAAAIVPSAVSNGVLLGDECDVPRTLEVDGVQCIIENGAGRDILKSGMASLSSHGMPRREVFTISSAAVAYIIAEFGRDLLQSIGLVMPLER